MNEYEYDYNILSLGCSVAVRKKLHLLFFIYFFIYFFYYYYFFVSFTFSLPQLTRRFLYGKFFWEV